jgi:hypothetical protein
MRTISSHCVVLKPVPVIVMDVPAGPCTGEIDETVPIVHGVNRNCKTLDGTACEHELGLINELETHDDAGTEAKYCKIKISEMNYCSMKMNLYLLVYNRVVDLYKLLLVNTIIEYHYQ